MKAPEREAMQRLRPDEFNPLLDQLARAYCANGGTWQALERMRAAGELPCRGTRRYRGSLCPKCFFYRRVSNEDEDCNAYAKRLVDPPVKREQCEQFISR